MNAPFHNTCISNFIYDDDDAQPFASKQNLIFHKIIKSSTYTFTKFYRYRNTNDTKNEYKGFFI